MRGRPMISRTSVSASTAGLCAAFLAFAAAALVAPKASAQVAQVCASDRSVACQRGSGIFSNLYSCPSDNSRNCVAATQCSDQIDNDGDNRIDFPNDAGCNSYSDVDEFNAPACNDGVDNDGDGFVDFPNDPGCVSNQDTTETAIGIQCDDGFDNDSDGLIDFPRDPDCTSVTDTTEATVTECNDGVDNDSDGLIDFPNDPGCASSTDSTEINAAFACDDGIDNDGDGFIDFPADNGCTSSTDNSEGNPPACSDGIDNDGDGFVDAADPGCADALDTSERNSAVQCDDGLDNDGDGTFDLADSDCTGPNDPVERPLACADGLDNDGDGLIDTSDPGCVDGNDDDEVNLAVCADGLDNDGDGQVDYPDDVGCGSYDDPTEDTVVCQDNCACSATADPDGADTTPDADPDAYSFQDCADYGDRTACPISRQECTVQSYNVFNPATGSYTTQTTFGCPYGAENACTRDPLDGKHYCSPHQCFSKASPVTESQDTDEAFPADDGPRDANGQCIGELRLFSGAAKRCRRSGVQTAFDNCCENKNPKMQDTMGAEGERDQITYREEESSFEFYENQCDQQDQETALLADSGYCVYLGTYCAEKWELVGCVQRNQAYCCFNSKLAAIIHEQGRAQIPSMNGFGSPSSPNCRGFTPEEFQSLDFSKIDMSAYESDIRAKGQATIKGEVQNDARSQGAP